MAVIALDLGGTKVSAALFTERGVILEETKVALAGRSGKAVGRLIQEHACALAQRASVRGHQVRSVGVCVPGISYPKTGRVWAPNITGWENYPLRDELEAALAKSRSPAAKPGLVVRVENDRACYIAGEAWKGAARKCGNAIFLAVGTGIGAGIMIDGKIVCGAHGTAGSIGWMALKQPFIADYAKWGCFEHHASGAGLEREGMRWRRETGSGSKSEVNARELFQSLNKGEAMGRDVLGQAVQMWGMAVANLVSLFDPEVIVFGGGVFGPGTKLLRAIRKEALKWAQPISMPRVRLVASRLGGRAGLYGAARIALADDSPPLT